MAKQKRKNWNEMSKVEKTIGLMGVVIIGFIALAIISGIVGVITGSGDNNPKETTKTEQKTVEEPKPQAQEQPKPKEISQPDAENVCQDANFLQNYINLENTSIVTFSYRPYFTDMGDGTKSLQWNGKDKTTDSSILFVCDVATEGDKVVVKHLAISGNTVYDATDN